MEVHFGYENHQARELVFPRILNEWEQAVVDEILADNAAAALARQQLATARVGAECSHCPSIWLDVDTDVAPILAPRFGFEEVTTAFPRAAVGQDSDGMTVQAILMVVDGYLHRLEVVRSDGGQVARRPLVEELSITILPSALP